MSRTFIKLDGAYVAWSTISDGPITPRMSLDELKVYVAQNDGLAALQEVPAMVERLEKTGTSSRGLLSLDRVLASYQQKLANGNAKPSLEQTLTALRSATNPVPAEECLDPAKPLVLFDSFTNEVTFKVTQVLATHGQVAVVLVRAPGDTLDHLTMVDLAEARVISSAKYSTLLVQYDEAEQSS